MTMPTSMNLPTSNISVTQSSPSESYDPSSIWGRIVSIPSKISKFFNNIWQQHGPKLTSIAERLVKAVGIGVVVGLLCSILTGSPLIMLGMGAAGGAGYLIGSEVHRRRSESRSPATKNI